MASSETKEYVLPRNETESQRLNLQHKGFVSSTGYLLHPRIISSLPTEPYPKIADVATGTGAWLLALESEMSAIPRTCSLYGLDISTGQFPSSSSTLCKFDTLDIRQPVPTLYHNFSDVVHIRMLLGGLTTPDWSVVARNVVDLLKPGGWIQWHEIDASSIRAYPCGPGPAVIEDSKTLLHSWIKGFRRWGKFMAEDMLMFQQRLGNAGFQHIKVHCPSSDRVPEMRSQISIAMCEAVGQAFTYLAKTVPDCGWSVEEAQQISARSRLELDGEQSYWRWDMHVLTAQKPATEQ